MPTLTEKFFHPQNAAAVTPSDSTNLTNRGILYVGGAGALSIITAGGQTVTLPAVAAGTILPIQVSRVRVTGTTATGIFVLY